MRKLIILSMSLLMCECLAANAEFEAVVKLAKQEAKNKKSDSYNQARHFNPQSVFDHYTRNPDQTKYFHGVTQKDTQQMDNDKIQSKTGESGTIIANSV